MKINDREKNEVSHSQDHRDLSRFFRVVMFIEISFKAIYPQVFLKDVQITKITFLYFLDYYICRL